MVHLMKFPTWINVYGDTDYRGACAREAVEQVTFFKRLRAKYPHLGGIALHPRNEGKRTNTQAAREKAEGMAIGASDVIIPVGPQPFVCEIKRSDHTKSKWQDGQQEYLEAAQAEGAFACVALGADAAMEALNDWLANRP